LIVVVEDYASIFDGEGAVSVLRIRPGGGPEPVY
jgi:hypothetical protein